MQIANATITFEQPSYTVSEGIGSLSVCVEIADLPSGGLACDLTVNTALISGIRGGT